MKGRPTACHALLVPLLAQWEAQRALPALPTPTTTRLDQPHAPAVPLDLCPIPSLPLATTLTIVLPNLATMFSLVLTALTWLMDSHVCAQLDTLLLMVSAKRTLCLLCL